MRLGYHLLHEEHVRLEQTKRNCMLKQHSLKALVFELCFSRVDQKRKRYTARSLEDLTAEQWRHMKIPMSDAVTKKLNWTCYLYWFSQQGVQLAKIVASTSWGLCCQLGLLLCLHTGLFVIELNL